MAKKVEYSTIPDENEVLAQKRMRDERQKLLDRNNVNIETADQARERLRQQLGFPSEAPQTAQTQQTPVAPATPGSSNPMETAGDRYAKSPLGKAVTQYAQKVQTELDSKNNSTSDNAEAPASAGVTSSPAAPVQSSGAAAPGESSTAGVTAAPAAPAQNGVAATPAAPAQRRNYVDEIANTFEEYSKRKGEEAGRQFDIDHPGGYAGMTEEEKQKAIKKAKRNDALAKAFGILADVGSATLNAVGSSKGAKPIEQPSVSGIYAQMLEEKKQKAQQRQKEREAAVEKARAGANADMKTFYTLNDKEQRTRIAELNAENAAERMKQAKNLNEAKIRYQEAMARVADLRAQGEQLKADNLQKKIDADLRATEALIEQRKSAVRRNNRSGGSGGRDPQDYDEDVTKTDPITGKEVTEHRQRRYNPPKKQGEQKPQGAKPKKLNYKPGK